LYSVRPEELAHIGMFPTVKAQKKFRAKRKFSRKQLAAQRLFAKRARAGTLRR